MVNLFLRNWYLRDERCPFRAKHINEIMFFADFSSVTYHDWRLKIFIIIWKVFLLQLFLTKFYNLFPYLSQSQHICSSCVYKVPIHSQIPTHCIAPQSVPLEKLILQSCYCFFLLEKQFLMWSNDKTIYYFYLSWYKDL